MSKMKKVTYPNVEPAAALDLLPPDGWHVLTLPGDLLGELEDGALLHNNLPIGLISAGCVLAALAPKSAQSVQIDSVGEFGVLVGLNPLRVSHAVQADRRPDGGLACRVCVWRVGGDNVLALNLAHFSSQAEDVV